MSVLKFNSNKLLSSEYIKIFIFRLGLRMPKPRLHFDGFGGI